MFNQESKTGWFPYTIPPTPIRDGNSEYALSFRGDGDPEKNPSEFLEWRKINESGSEPEPKLEFFICVGGIQKKYLFSAQEVPL
jgi:hypothetical protein